MYDGPLLLDICETQKGILCVCVLRELWPCRQAPREKSHQDILKEHLPAGKY